jgi:ElaB/YqjD/DUF883 family membrane-anchored ribosome-binding protein
MNDIRSDVSVRSEVLARDAQALLADVQTLLRDIGEDAGTQVSLSRAELGTRLRGLQARLDGMRRKGQARVSRLASETDRYVHKHPWQSMATIVVIAAATGAVSALAVSRR